MFGLISALGLLLAGVPAPMPSNMPTLPNEVRLIPSEVEERLMIEYSRGVKHEFQFDFTKPRWSLAEVSDTNGYMVFNGYWYVANDVRFDFYIDDDTDEPVFNLRSMNFLRLEGSALDEIGDYKPFPVAWQSYVYNNYALLAEKGSAIWYGLDVGELGSTVTDTFSFTDNSVRYAHRQSVPVGSLPAYSLSVSDWATFKGNVAEHVYPYALSVIEEYSKGYDVGYGYGYNTGMREGKVEGYNEGINATSTGALAGSLFGSIVAIPLDVLNGLNSFVIWGIPVVSILVTFTLIAVIVVVIKRFI